MSAESSQPIGMPAMFEALVADERFSRLAGTPATFNIFATVGPRWKETDHSACLAFLFDPKETHYLGDAVLHAFLHVVRGAKKGDESSKVRSIPDDMSMATVETEVHHIHKAGADSQQSDAEGKTGFIDILIRDEAHMLVVIVENKTGSKEHDSQLQRYYEVIEREHKGWQIVPLYLSPAGESPLHASLALGAPSAESSFSAEWIAVGYGQLYTALMIVANDQDRAMDKGVRVLLEHYADFIRRKLVGEDEDDMQCRSLYSEYRVAIEKINQRVEIRYGKMRVAIERLVKQPGAFVLDNTWPGNGALSPLPACYIRVAYKPWDQVLDHHLSNGKWTPSKRMLLFTFNVFRDHLDMNLMIGPGDLREREALMRMAGHAPLQAAKTNRNGVDSWSVVYEETILSVEQWAASSHAAIERAVRDWWETFTTQTVPAIDHQARLYVLETSV